MAVVIAGEVALLAVMAEFGCAAAAMACGRAPSWLLTMVVDCASVCAASVVDVTRSATADSARLDEAAISASGTLDADADSPEFSDGAGTSSLAADPPLVVVSVSLADDFVLGETAAVPEALDDPVSAGSVLVVDEVVEPAPNVEVIDPRLPPLADTVLTGPLPVSFGGETLVELPPLAVTAAPVGVGLPDSDVLPVVGVEVALLVWLEVADPVAGPGLDPVGSSACASPDPLTIAAPSPK
jgi:hypothetical protein